MAIQNHSHITKMKAGSTMSLGRSAIIDNVNFVVTVMHRTGPTTFTSTGDPAPVKDTDFSVDFAAGTVSPITSMPKFYKFDFDYDDGQEAIDAAAAAVAAEDSACNAQCASDLVWLTDAGVGGLQEDGKSLAALETAVQRLGNYLSKLVPIIQRPVDPNA